MAEPELITKQLPYAAMVMFCFFIFATSFLIVFVEPPTPFWVGGTVLAGDWRPTLLAVAPVVIFGLILYVPPLRAIYDLPFVQPQDLAIAFAASVVWMFTVRWAWRMRVLDRMLGFNLSPQSQGDPLIPAPDYAAPKHSTKAVQG